MSALTLIGLAAACCTTLAYVPQVVKAWRTKSTADISTRMFVVMVTGLALWLTYSAMLGDIPLILANIGTLSLAATVLVLKLRYGVK